MINILKRYSGVFSVGILFSLQVSAQETIVDYANRCDEQIGVSVPAFYCSNGTVIEDTDENGNCVNPKYINYGNGCDPGSTYQTLVDNGESFVVAVCRKSGYSVESDIFKDIAVIQHNRTNGATCFYQREDNELGRQDFVGDPVDDTGTSNGWVDPDEITEYRCVNCHSNGPIIPSPWLRSLDSVPGAHTLPNNVLNEDGDPYWFPAEDDSDLNRARTVSVGTINNPCINCHRLSIATFPRANDTLVKRNALIFGEMAVRQNLESTVVTHLGEGRTFLEALPSGAERWWMPPIQSSYSSQSERNLDDIIECSELFESVVNNLNGPVFDYYYPFSSGLQFSDNRFGHCIVNVHPRIIDQPAGLPDIDEDAEDQGLVLYNTGDYPWKRHSGKTPTGSSSSYNTGPSSGAFGSNYYYYFETSSGQGAYLANETSILESDFFDPEDKVLSYDFHMHGVNVGRLHVDFYVNGSWVEYWPWVGERGPEWESTKINLQQFSGFGPIKVRFKAVANGGFQGDIAIDNILVKRRSEPNTYQLYASANADSSQSYFINEGNINWQVGSGGTPSSNTGPSGGARNSNSYYYVEASGRQSSDIAIFKLANTVPVKHTVLSFDYHMYGSDTTTLKIEYSKSHGWETLWEKTGNQGDSWKTAKIKLSKELPVNIGSKRFRFIVTDFNGSKSDIAIDNIKFSK